MVVVVVAALSMEASFTREDANFPQDVVPAETVPSPLGPPWDVFDDPSAERAQFRLIVYGLNAALLLIALANLLTTALLAVRERVRAVGVLTAVGSRSCRERCSPSGSSAPCRPSAPPGSGW